MVLYNYRKGNNSPKRKMVNYFSYVFLVIGALLLFWSFYPIISFEIYSRLFIQNKVQSPIPNSNIVSSLEQANSVLGNFNVFSNNLRDFTKINLWFPGVVQSNEKKTLAINKYYLSIPKLNIQEATVIVGGEELAKSLVHYLPKSLPGEYGNVVIFGHSTLPQLYNPKDYKSIFTYLPSLEKNDKILVKVRDIVYEYEVYDMFVINPDQISVLEPRNDAAYITLVTCVPPGTYWKRLIIRAKLTKLPDNF